MFKKSALAMAAVIAAMTLSVPVMAQTDAPANAPARPVLYSIAVNKKSIPVKALDKTMYVTADMLYIRDIPSTDGEIIGAFYYGEGVKVTGKTEKNGEDPGWFRIIRNDKEGYVTAEFLTDATSAAAPAGNAGGAVQTAAAPAAAAPAAVAPASTAPAAAGQNIIKSSYVYAKDGSLVAIYKKADGSWFDNNGTKVTWVTDNQATTAGGQALTSFNPTTGPATGSYPVSEGVYVNDASGNSQGMMTPYSDGNYYSNDMQRYEDNGDGTFYGAGETLYVDPFQGYM